MECDKKISEINREIREALDFWADICVSADADRWAYFLDYYPRDVINATFIFQHVLSNVGIKSGHINKERAVLYGQRLRELVIEMTGYDPANVIDEMDDL